jgi:hypothetical protein
MNTPPLDDAFNSTLRKALVARVDESAIAKKRRNLRWWLGVGVFAGAGLIGGAAAAGILVLPGGDVVTSLSSPVSETHTGTAVVELGPVPAGVTHVAAELTCLTPGSFVVDDGASFHCDASDIGTGAARSSFSVSLASGAHAVGISTDANASWALVATYVNQSVTDWATNEHGESYGIQNASGTPDLIAVIATNGKHGYARSADLHEANGTKAASAFASPEEALAWQETDQEAVSRVPVYETDGRTLVGDFDIGSR